jgi:formate-nitrite transporter family protein
MRLAVPCFEERSPVTDLPHSEPLAEGAAEGVKDLSQHMPSEAAAIHEIVRRDGERELRRTFSALLWSAIAGGITISVSFMARGVIQANLPPTEFGFLIEAAGYTLGFIFVICGRQQLFTENTITPVLPFMSDPTRRQLRRLLRLWGTVLLGNTLGGLIAALVFAFMPVLPAEVHEAFARIGHHLLERPWHQMLAGGVIAGWLMATLVWVAFATPESKVALIFLVTYVIAIGGFPHVIVGTTEAFYMLLLDEASLREIVFTFWLPTLVGNVLGGTFIFALISHAQVRADID